MSYGTDIAAPFGKPTSSPHAAISFQPGQPLHRGLFRNGSLYRQHHVAALSRLWPAVPTAAASCVTAASRSMVPAQLSQPIASWSGSAAPQQRVSCTKLSAGSRDKPLGLRLAIATTIPGRKSLACTTAQQPGWGGAFCNLFRPQPRRSVSCSAAQHNIAASSQATWQEAAEVYAQAEPQTRPQSDFLDQLSAEQRAAVVAPDQYIRVIAGPGSGKTRVLTARVAHLCMRGGVSPFQIVAITFTNKAAKELQTRLEGVLEPVRARQVASGTFHSFAHHLLRRYIGELKCGWDSSFTIYDQTDALAAYMQSIKAQDSYQRLSTAERKALLKSSGAILEIISNMKNSDPFCFGVQGSQAVERYERFLQRSGEDLRQKHKLDAFELEQAYDAYRDVLLQNRALDFDDLLTGAVAVLQRVPEACSMLQARFRHLLVDEFQDTNGAQYELVRLLAGDQGSLFVVGDPDQAIYGWRGAMVENMRQLFLKDYPGAVTLNLRDNYRSTPEVLATAERALACAGSTSPDRRPLVPVKASGQRVQVISAPTDYEETEEVVAQIQRLHRCEGYAYRDMAVLYRMHVLQRYMEEPLVAAGLPYVVVSGTKFWDKKEIRDVLAFLRVASHFGDGVALDRSINVPVRGLGPKSITKLKDWARGRGESLGPALFAGHEAARLSADWQSVEELPELPSAKELGISAQAHRNLDAFRQAILRARCLASQLGSPAHESLTLAEVIHELLEDLGYEEHVRTGGLGSSDEKAQSLQLRWANVMQLQAIAGDYSRKSDPGSSSFALDADYTSLASLGPEDGNHPTVSGPSMPAVFAHQRPGQSPPFLANRASRQTTNGSVAGTAASARHATPSTSSSGSVPSFTSNGRSASHAFAGVDLSPAASAQSQGPSQGPGRGLDVLRGFLDEVALLTDADTAKDDKEGVRLMSLHAAKGLEFKVVFIIGCEEGILPRVFESQTSEQLDEEIRLGYVGVTRAQNCLFLCHAHSRALWGSRSRKDTQPSRIISAHLKQQEENQLQALKARLRNYGQRSG